MPWTAKQERFMWARHPDIAKRVMNEPGYRRRRALKKLARGKRKTR